MEEADQLCDRVAIMDHGKILALDTPAALKQSVGADTIVTVTADGDLDALATLLARGASPGVDPHPGGRRRRRAARPRAPPAAARVVRWPSAAGFDVVDLSVAEPTLETVFINLTGKELRD